PPRAPERRLSAPLAVRLGGAPVDVVAALRVDAAHVDALHRARLGALEARLALQRAVLVVQELQAAPELRRHLLPDLRVADRRLRLEEADEGRRHAPGDPETGQEAHALALSARPRRSPRPSRTGSAAMRGGATSMRRPLAGRSAPRAATRASPRTRRRSRTSLRG